MATSTKPTSLSFFPILIVFFPYLCLCQSRNNSYDTCPPFDCGNFKNITFPFSLYEPNMGTSCGLPGFSIVCQSTGSRANIILSGKPFQLKTIYPVNDRYPSENLMVVSDTDLLINLASDDCKNLQDLSLSPSKIAQLELPPGNTNLTFFRCPKELTLPADFVDKVLNYSQCKADVILYLARSYSDLLPNLEVPSVPNGCTYIRAAFLQASLLSFNRTNRPSSLNSTTDLLEILGNRLLNKTDLLEILGKGFFLQWPKIDNCSACTNTNGRCGFEANPGGSDGRVVCFHKTGQTVTGSSRRWKVILGVTITTAFIILVIVALLIFKFKHKAMSILHKDYFKSSRSKENDRNIEEFIKSYRSTLVTKYSYTDIQKMTNGFKEKLGEGGYGNVFKGKLADGRLVAAKMLEKLHDNGRDFVNEVATIGTIHHVNIIRLLGYCWEGSRRALVYEFMPNGSLGDLIFKDNLAHFLGWPKLLEIAIGIAHGIEYLHQGCDTRILHLDIKPHNVLLDENYHPKISDFGLAKSYSRKRSMVSLTNAKGTIGYISPEIIFRSLGGVSHKSDVYSYGMLLLEMVGGRKNVIVKSEYSSLAYFPNWIYNQITRENEMEFADLIIEEDSSIPKKMAMVGLWCVQMNPADRPSMNRVVEMLTGSVEGIEMPPKPFLFSPPQPQVRHEISVAGSNTNDLPLM